MDELSKSRKRANKKWNDANKSETKVYHARLQARKFISEYANEDDLIDESW